MSAVQVEITNTDWWGILVASGLSGLIAALTVVGTLQLNKRYESWQKDRERLGQLYKVLADMESDFYLIRHEQENGQEESESYRKAQDLNLYLRRLIHSRWFLEQMPPAHSVSGKIARAFEYNLRRVEGLRVYGPLDWSELDESKRRSILKTLREEEEKALARALFFLHSESSFSGWPRRLWERRKLWWKVRKARKDLLGGVKELLQTAEAGTQ